MNPPPLVDVDQPLVNDFRLLLPFPMARRVENRSLVFWHSPRRLTFWIDAFDTDGEEDPLRRWHDTKSPFAADEIVERESGVVRMAYRLAAPETGATEPALHGLVSDGLTEIIFAAYFDFPDMAEPSLASWRSIGPRAASNPAN